MSAYEVIIPTCNMELAKEAQRSMSPIKSRIFDGSNFESFSKLINSCVVSSDKEIIVICNDKARPKEQDVYRLLDLVNKGYGVSGLYRFGFFAFKKDLMRLIGFMDERYVGGEYENCDFLRRLKEKDIGYYEDESIEYAQLPSRWVRTKALQHFKAKWDEIPGSTRRMLPEESYAYNIGPFRGSSFLGWGHSVLMDKDNFKEWKIS